VHRDEVLEEIIKKAVVQTLSTIGIDVSDRHGLKADLAHLRRWRRSVEQAQSYTMRTVITVLVTGIAGAMWMGIKMLLPGHN
jgi:hypothetical protein